MKRVPALASIACCCIYTCRLRHQRTVWPRLDRTDRRRERHAELYETRRSQLDGQSGRDLGRQKNFEGRRHPAIERVVHRTLKSMPNSGQMKRPTAASHSRHESEGRQHESRIRSADLEQSPAMATASLMPPAKASPSFKAANKWSTFLITAKGPRMTVTMDGVQAVDVNDTAFTSGPIALSVQRRHDQIQEDHGQAAIGRTKRKPAAAGFLWWLKRGSGWFLHSASRHETKQAKTGEQHRVGFGLGNNPDIRYRAAVTQ